MTQPFAIGVGPATGSRPTLEIVDALGWTLDNNLDDGCSLSFTARAVSPAVQAIAELASDLWLYRGGNLVQRFRVVNLDQAWSENGDNTVQVSAVCYRRLLKKAHVRTPLSFVQQSQGDIVWDLVQHAQAATGGSLGITLSSAGPSILRDREYAIGQNIYDAIVDLATIDQGISWNVTGTLGLVVDTQTSFSTAVQPVELGVTARAMKRPSSSNQFANAAIVTGNSESTTPVIAEDVNVGTDPRGRWERFLSVGASSTQDELVETADGLIQTAISPLATWETLLDPFRYFLDAEYEIGQFVTIVAPPYAIGVPSAVSAQTISRQVSLTADGDLTVVCTFVETP